jgi:hypothetical protein
VFFWLQHLQKKPLQKNPLPAATALATNVRAGEICNLHGRDYALLAVGKQTVQVGQGLVEAASSSAAASSSWQ